MIHLIHCRCVEMSHFFAQSSLVERSDLLQKNNGVSAESVVRRIDPYMRRKFRLAEL